MLDVPGPAEILRSVQKDRDFVQKLGADLSDLIQRLFGQRTWLTWRVGADSAAVLAYYALTNLSGFQTLGEEYAGIVQVNQHTRKIPSKLQLMGMVSILCYKEILRGWIFILQLLEQRGILTKGISSSLKNQLEEIEHAGPLIRNLHLVLFFWEGKFYHLAKRITKIQYVLVRQWFKTGSSLFLLRWMSLINVLLTGAGWFFRPKSIQAENNDEEAVGACRTSCSLCLSPLDHPSLSSCGHLYCYSCILYALANRPECPVCRQELKPSRVIPLLNF